MSESITFSRESNKSIDYTVIIRASIQNKSHTLRHLSTSYQGIENIYRIELKEYIIYIYNINNKCE